MLQLEEARQRILARVPLLPAQSVPLPQALDRHLSSPQTAPIDLPPFDNSAMDGYAVRAQDVAVAAEDTPVRLLIQDRVAAGETAGTAVRPGGCVRVFTGSVLPPGADAVVMQEDTRHETADPRHLRVLSPVKPWENVRFRGEDVKQGSHLFAPGQRVTAGVAALLAALGRTDAPVYEQPRVGVIATGNELQEPGQPLAPGHIYESNRTTLSILLARTGALPRLYPRTPDQLEPTCAVLRQALSENHAVITTGGVSVGELDLVKEAFAGLGGQTDFWRVAVRPGKPFMFGEYQQKLLFGLPGNPVSALVTFLLLVRPALLKMQGAADLDLPAVPAQLSEPLSNMSDRRHFMRVCLHPDGRVSSAGSQASHILSSVARANGLVDVPPQTTLSAGATVRVLHWDA